MFNLNFAFIKEKKENIVKKYLLLGSNNGVCKFNPNHKESNF